jgi:dTDP-glucose 4,6-dehydratase
LPGRTSSPSRDAGADHARIEQLRSVSVSRKADPADDRQCLEGRKLPVYGAGQQVRDWLDVDDHCRAIKAVLDKGREGEIYNIGGNRSLPNLEVVHKVLQFTGKPESLIEYVKARPGHDRRYALSSEKLMHETGWEPIMSFETGLARTIEWYRANTEWIARARGAASTVATTNATTAAGLW